MKQQRIHGKADSVIKDSGRVARISRHRGDRKPIAYIVAACDAAEAVELIRHARMSPADAVWVKMMVADS